MNDVAWHKLCWWWRPCLSPVKDSECQLGCHEQASYTLWGAARSGAVDVPVAVPCKPRRVSFCELWS